MHFDPTISVGNLITIVMFWLPGIWWAASIDQRVKDISKKLDLFITRSEVIALKEGADAEHDAIRREFDLLRRGNERGN